MSEQPGRPAHPVEQGRDPAGPPPGPAPGPMGPPPGPPPVERTGRRALWLGVVALVTSLFFYPLGLVLGVAALVIGIRARRRARTARAVAPGAVPGIVLGSVGLAFSALSVALTVFLWPELSGYQECLGAANTGTDKTACKHEYFPKIEKKLDLPRGQHGQVRRPAVTL
ncbi:hypothetical protein F8568_039465 [Actinomadura sp. LD22]|uniref:DUF4190 domain-containing protein n=1 Tax=Actinomadura physcomitrii TaxID=2650748 RepID=A0A6I4MSI4_9ACTN|nr:hypothetical protein [Actinomadura physcomitrii]MWA06321.1 hypothetical protein [Actinomadura physcomitrii]